MTEERARYYAKGTRAKHGYNLLGGAQREYLARQDAIG
jgi:hypothetical protein